MIYIHCQKIDNMWYAATVQNNKVFATAFSSKEQQVMRHLLENLPYNIPFQVAEKPTQLLTELLKTLKAIFDGKDSASYGFKIATNHLSSYARRVLKYTSMISVGYITTYGAIAKVAGGSPRSVGRVEALNPFPLFIPCHRVVRSDFSVGGYGLGEKTKLQLLQREDRGYEKTRSLKVEDKQLSLFPIKFLLKEIGKN